MALLDAIYGHMSFASQWKEFKFPPYAMFGLREVTRCEKKMTVIYDQREVSSNE